jgi:hypothetical protein
VSRRTWGPEDERLHPRDWRTGEFVERAEWIGALVRRMNLPTTDKPPGKSLSYDDLESLLDREFKPAQLEARREIHPKSGFEVKVGKERHVKQVARGQEGPPVFSVQDHGEFPNRPLFPVNLEDEPIEHVYRGISVEEWRQALERGYLKSDQRGVLVDWEGTNAAVDPRSAASYLPRGGSGVIVKIKVDPEQEWFTIGADSYIRTRNRIPLDLVEHVSPVIHKDDRTYLYLDEDTPRGRPR